MKRREFTNMLAGAVIIPRTVYTGGLERPMVVGKEAELFLNGKPLRENIDYAWNEGKIPNAVTMEFGEPKTYLYVSRRIFDVDPPYKQLSFLVLHDYDTNTRTIVWLIDRYNSKWEQYPLKEDDDS